MATQLRPSARRATSATQRAARRSGLPARARGLRIALLTASAGRTKRACSPRGARIRTKSSAAVSTARQRRPLLRGASRPAMSSSTAHAPLCRRHPRRTPAHSRTTTGRRTSGGRRTRLSSLAPSKLSLSSTWACRRARSLVRLASAARRARTSTACTPTTTRSPTASITPPHRTPRLTSRRTRRRRSRRSSRRRLTSRPAAPAPTTGAPSST
mmetsp:Transcript_45760/g.147375  ORF Transcript_45760/g.147375 Transcript_45760/m.147375 type:complete len:213 (+) Transcript_45760:1200-1838(+)